MARRFLNRYGNPYMASGPTPAAVNQSTGASTACGDLPDRPRRGTIAYKLIGPITAENLVKALEPKS